ncbi:MAG: putative transporter [Methanosaeta sp. PtaB.Bin039]|nr:MAG: putative transporter [Methanosaeta sp. PtaB.Bin039]HOT06916.1 MFS transporter [Methanotrichaceae archaeon]HQF16462.1 MFS transporter [Methanotrichaceae archaeon]HQI91885.1 MFS transporter [Methanotrichaceae archaeon]HQJ28442.1 MFS transporter [Methanotrichaceae archaeon]
MQPGGQKDVQRCAVWIAAFSSFLTPFMGASVNIAMPTISAEFSLDAITLSWVAMSFLLAAAVLLVPAGRLGDIWGRKKIFGYGIALFTVSSLLAGISTSAQGLILFRFLQGAGSAMIFGTGVAILTSVFPPQDRGRVLGLNIAVVYLGLSTGPVLGGFLTQQLGWRSLFLLTVPLGLLTVYLTYFRLNGEWADAGGERFDVVGSLIYGASILALVYGLSLLPEFPGGPLVLLGVALLAAFIWVELKVSSPVMNVRLFRNNRVFAFSNLTALINYSATFACGFLLSLYLQYIDGLSPQMAGLVLVSQPLVMTIFSPWAGRLSDRVEPRVVASIGMLFTVLGVSPLALLGWDTPLWFVVLSQATLGFGLALFSSPNTNAIMSAVERKYYGVASATLGTMRLLGQMTSMSLAMLIFALYMGRVEIVPEYYERFLDATRAAFLLFSMLCAAGVATSLARGDMHHEKR